MTDNLRTIARSIPRQREYELAMWSDIGLGVAVRCASCAGDNRFELNAPFVGELVSVEPVYASGAATVTDSSSMRVALPSRRDRHRRKVTATTGPLTGATDGVFQFAACHRCHSGASARRADAAAAIDAARRCEWAHVLASTQRSGRPGRLTGPAGERIAPYRPPRLQHDDMIGATR